MNPFKLNKFQRKKLIALSDRERDSLIERRLNALIWLDEGKTVAEVAGLLRVCTRTIENWVQLYREGGVRRLITLQHRGDPGKLNNEQKQKLLDQVKTGEFRTTKQIIAWIKEQFKVEYTLSGVKVLLDRIGVTYHKVKGLLWKGNPVLQREFVKKYHGQRSAAKRASASKTRFYFVDACHPVYGLGQIYSFGASRGMNTGSGWEEVANGTTFWGLTVRTIMSILTFENTSATLVLSSS